MGWRYRPRMADADIIFPNLEVIVDDFLAEGQAMNALIDIVHQAGAIVVGCGVAIEKGFQKGGRELREQGYHVESIAIVDEMDYEKGTITFRN